LALFEGEILGEKNVTPFKEFIKIIVFSSSHFPQNWAYAAFMPTCGAAQGYPGQDEECSSGKQATLEIGMLVSEFLSLSLKMCKVEYFVVFHRWH